MAETLEVTGAPRQKVRPEKPPEVPTSLSEIARRLAASGLHGLAAELTANPRYAQEAEELEEKAKAEKKKAKPTPTQEAGAIGEEADLKEEPDGTELDPRGEKGVWPRPPKKTHGR